MKQILTLALLVFCVIKMTAQKEYIKIGENYPKAKIFLKGAGEFKVKNVKQINDTLVEYTIIKQGIPVNQQVASRNIGSITIRKGNHMMEYGVAGGLTGLLCILYAILEQKKDDPNYDGKGNAGVIAGITTGGFVAGAIIGLASPKHKTLYPYEKDWRYLMISPSINKDYCGLGISINF